ncbi:MAG: metal-dependent transcriptional regulator [candidate division KSB1 bacterium]|nr:metal-dependent transcriptional regulator [candidate division KSB1 bacterium]
MNSDFDTTTQEYIEVIFSLEQDKHIVRVTDIASRRGVTKSSVSLVLNQLQKKDLVHRKQYGHIHLTPLGRQLAEHLETRHQTIKNMLVKVLDLDEETADHDACELEHVISSKTLNKINQFLQFIDQCNQPWDKILKVYHDCSIYNKGVNTCEQCPQIEIYESKARKTPTRSLS